ncbi:hypothetical protein E6H31_06145 [Candidatus Bathyarchaeota archaeon]|nr:MAG: hypothetical protein E6H31_06145 [Candidatus Bathyarchaeota archaeon]
MEPPISVVGGAKADLLRLVLDGVLILVLVACIVWMVRFNISQQKGERSTLKWRDMDPIRKTVAGLISVWICLNLYLSVGNELANLNVVVLPLGSIYSFYGPILVWASASSIVGLALLLSIRFPRRPVIA